MKKLFTFFVFLFTSYCAHTQIPQAFSFQGIAFNSNGQPLSSANIAVQTQILNGSSSGTIVYSEVHKTTTNATGLYTLSIGLGTPNTGIFSNIDWASGQKFLTVAIDPDGGSNFTAVGVSQLLSVPYALVSGNSVVSKPNIFVTKHPINNVIKVNPFSFVQNQGYLYKWIDGTPEHVFVDYKNLPSNIHISTNKSLNTGDFGDNFSKTDTIDFGLYERTSGFVVTDTDAPISYGLHKIEAVFRNQTQRLDSVLLDMEILGISSSCPDDLFKSRIFTKAECKIDSTDITTTDSYIESLIGSSMNFSPLSSDFLTMSNFLNSNQSCQVEIANNCMDLFFNQCYLNSTNNRSFSIRDGLIMPDLSLQFRISVYENISNKEINCIIDYR